MVPDILGHPLYTVYIHVHLQYIITHTFIILLVAHLCMEWDALVSLYRFLPSTMYWPMNYYDSLS